MGILNRLKCPILIYLCAMASWAADSGSAVVAAGYQVPTPVLVAPGQVITFFVHGIGSGLTGPVHAATLPLPNSLAGISAMVVGITPTSQVPMLAIEPVETCIDPTRAGCGTYMAITVQMPLELPARSPDEITGAPPLAAELAFSENGVVKATVELVSWVDQIHLLRDCDVSFTLGSSGCHPIATHADGTLITTNTPARAGEQIVLYAFGLGTTNPPVPAGQAATVPTPTSVPFSISFDPRQNAQASRPPVGGAPAASPLFAGLTTGYAGLYQINVTVPRLPAGSLACSNGGFSYHGIQTESNLTINIGGRASFDGV
ncbi:MAG TPA: hypothetical protein VJN43_11480 [Bryobacteraceae bacterium]|nr:hypothetical protein [Bryobacteraceae bacterium]